VDTTTPPLAGDGAPRLWAARRRAAGARLPWPALTGGTAALYFASIFDRGWIPHDEGTLGQTAWRILLGEVPHRDFDALYTGLLGYLNAAAMTVMGVHLLAPRTVLLLAFLAWVAVVWSVLSRFAAPPVASAPTLLCVTIGPAIYPAAMPSWYNLFLATGGLWALIRWTEDGGSRWLFAAGAFAGVSVLFKITGRGPARRRPAGRARGARGYGTRATVSLDRARRLERASHSLWA
jgi:hypothetical protein